MKMMFLLIIVSFMNVGCSYKRYIDDKFELCYNTYHNGQKFSWGPGSIGHLAFKRFTVNYSGSGTVNTPTNEAGNTLDGYNDSGDGYPNYYSDTSFLPKDLIELTESTTASSPLTYFLQATSDIGSDCRMVDLPCSRAEADPHAYPFGCRYDLKDEANIKPWLETIAFGITQSDVYLHSYNRLTSTAPIIVEDLADVVLVGIKKSSRVTTVYPESVEDTNGNHANDDYDYSKDPDEVRIVTPTVYVNYHFFDADYSPAERRMIMKGLRREETEVLDAYIEEDEDTLFVSALDVLSGEYSDYVEEYYSADEEEKLLDLIRGPLNFEDDL